jgi:hypothetical protein
LAELQATVDPQCVTCDFLPQEPDRDALQSPETDLGPWPVLSDGGPLPAGHSATPEAAAEQHPAGPESALQYGV